MKKIPLTQGKFALVDVMRILTNLIHTNGALTIMAITRSEILKIEARTRDKLILMHRFILNTQDGIEVDHRNGNTLDNRRSNLRPATKQQNGFNRGRNRNNRSGFKGVCWRKDAQKWLAYISLNRKHISLGVYVTKREAIKARLLAAQEHHGEFFHP